MKQPHINCDENDIYPRVIVCGDPARVERIAKLGQDAKFVSSNREFTVYEAFYNGIPFTICSTGIGGVSALIAMEELIKCGMKAVVRIGSAGSLQKNIHNGELIIVEGAVRCDGASRMYVGPEYPAVSDMDLVHSIRDNLSSSGITFHKGVVYSHDSFYTDRENDLCRYWSSFGVLGADMETASIITHARFKGIKAASILNVVVEFTASAEEGIADYKDANADLLKSEAIASKAAFYALSKLNI